jgi:hypothetical protein
VVRVHDNARRMVRIVVTTGSRLPLESAQGKVFRAFMGEDDGESGRVRRARAGYFRDVVDGIAALTARVFQGEEIVATIAPVGTTCGVESSQSQTVHALRGAADSLTAELGFVGIDRRSA